MAYGCIEPPLMIQKIAAPIELLDAWDRVQPHTRATFEQSRAVWVAVHHVIENKIPGSLVECGVLGAGSSVLMALALLSAGIRDRDIFLFDESKEDAQPQPKDDISDGHHECGHMGGATGRPAAELTPAPSSFADARKAIGSIGYPAGRIHVIKGSFLETMPRAQTLGIALLRVNTDCGESMRACLDQLYARVSLHAPVIIDDPGHSAMAAVDAFFSTGDVARPMMWPLDRTECAFTKPQPATAIEIARYDRVPPGCQDRDLLPLFPHATNSNPWAVAWPYLRKRVPHIFRLDSRDTAAYPSGYASLEEALYLAQLAEQFAGRRGLEIGTHFGWTGAHLRSAELELDCIDPELAEQDRWIAVDDVFRQVRSNAPYRLWPAISPEAISDIASAGSARPFSFVFIDGDHRAPAPQLDAEAVLPHCAEDATVVFHDLLAPDVEKGLAVFARAGWRCYLVNTMQVLGVACRGEAQPIPHSADTSCPSLMAPHLHKYPCLST